MTDERQDVARVMLRQLASEGLTPEDLAALRDSGAVGGQVTVAAYAAEVRKSYKPSTLGTYDTYFRHLVDGLPWMCGCLCDACVDVYGRSLDDGAGSRPMPCPCDGGACGCPPAKLADAGAVSCAQRWHGLGERAVASLAATDVEQAMRWAQVRAVKHWEKRNRARRAKGRAMHPHDGRNAAEHAYTVFRALVRRALADPATGLRHDITAPVAKVRRKPQKARAFTAEQLLELWQAIFTTGSNDPDLDALLVWFHLETGARRKGGVELRVEHLSWSRQVIRLVEKYDDDAWQPVSMKLLLALTAHTLERGGDVVAWTAPGLDPRRVVAQDVAEGRARLRPDAPVFYYRRRRRVVDDGVKRPAPWPLSPRRYNTLFDRLQEALPWADEIGARPHDLRKTGATFIERAFGHAVARGWLRHRTGNQTDGYVLASERDVAYGNQWMTGCPHPAAGGEPAHSRR